MNNPYPDLETTVRDYVLNRLSDKETEEFEEYYFSNPEIIEMVDAVININIGLENAKQPLNVEFVKPAGSSDKDWLRTLVSWISVPVPAYLAIVMVMVAAPLAYKGLSPSNFPDQLALVSFSTDVTRSADTPLELDLSDLQGAPAIFVKVKRVEHKYYVLKVNASDSDHSIWSSEPFKVSSLRDKLVVLPAAVKKDQVTIKVFGIEQDGIETSVEFCHYSEVCK
jgi:hypothetical protein